MMRPGCAVRLAAKVAALLAAPVAVAGCSDTQELPPDLAAVAPGAAYNDDPLGLSIMGSSPFRPGYRLETASGVGASEASGFTVALEPTPTAVESATLPRVPATEVDIDGPELDRLVASLPAQIAPGSYDVVVVDPRGTRRSKAGAFLCLGTDHDAPTVSIALPRPETVIGADTDVKVQFTADDGPGRLSLLGWNVSREGSPGTVSQGSCTQTGSATHTGGCMFSFPAPSPLNVGDRLSIEAQATDSRGNVGTSTIFLYLAPRPTVTAFSPNAGPTGGGTLVTVEGADFVADATQIFMGESPLPTTVQGSTVVSARTVGHDAGQVAVTVRTAGASTRAGPFSFIAAPIVRQVIPGVGSPAGGTPVSIVGNNFRADATAIHFVADDGMAADLLCPRFRGPNRIDGYAPAGSGTLAVVAIDAIGGVGRRDSGFTYSDATAPGVSTADGCPDDGSTP